jgi:hypothetical protein
MTDRDRTPERPRRPEVGRTGPIRNLGGLFRSPGHGTPGPGPGSPASSPDIPRPLAPDEAVARAVRAGFEVAEQAVRRGLGGARAAFGGDDGTGEAGGEWSTGWTAGPYVDAVAGAATRWIDAWASLVQQAITVGGAAARSAVPARPAAAGDAATASTSATRLVVEVRSRRPASVQLDLTAPHDGALATHGLHAPPALGAPALTEVALTVDGDGRLRIRVEVPDTQPAGAYVGAVVTSSGDAIGTIAVRLAE